VQEGGQLELIDFNGVVECSVVDRETLCLKPDTLSSVFLCGLCG